MEQGPHTPLSWIREGTRSGDETAAISPYLHVDTDVEHT